MATKKRYKRVEVSRKDFLGIVTDRQGCTFISLKSKTIPHHFHLWLSGRPFPWIGNIYCYTHISCLVGANYENSMNNALERQGKPRDFKQSGEPWGPKFRHANDAAVIRHIEDGRMYLQVHVTYRKYDYRRADNHHRIKPQELRRWLKPSQDRENVVCRRYRFDHITEIIMRLASENEAKRYILTD